MKLTCSKCFGNKTYRGMGSMIIKCEPCDGTGQVNIEVKPDLLEDKKPSKKPRKGELDEKTNTSSEKE